MSIGRNLFTSQHLGERDDLSFVTEEMYLGVWINQDLDVSMQCQQIRQCKQLVLLNKFSNNIKASFPTLYKYKSYIRPHLEYSTQVWCPYKMKDINISEKV